MAHVDGRRPLIYGALTGEKVAFRYSGKHKRHDEADLVEVLQASLHRVVPKCSAFGRCGGCSLQYLAAAAQIATKLSAAWRSRTGEATGRTSSVALCTTGTWSGSGIRGERFYPGKHGHQL